MNLTTLRQNIEQYFNEEELRTLCFDLGVDYDSLGGRGKAANVTELVALCQRNGQFNDLLTQLSHTRPSVNWPIQNESNNPQPLSGPVPIPETAAERRIRNDFLQKERINWIHGVLEKSLHNILRLDLGFTYKPDVVSRSWSMTLQQPDISEQELPDDVSILEIFRQHQRELLILGEPGAGKTITLLELTRDLIILAESDETQPIPVILNLSSWAEKQLPFAAWLENALLDEYQVSRKVGKKWLATDYQLTLLLDGLDEVQKEHREACVTAINEFRADHMMDIVISSRTADYEDLQTRLNIATAVMLRPLTLEQIDAYLTAGGDSLAALRQTIQDDAHFQALAQTPLLLSIMTMTYRNQPRGMSQDDSRPVEQRQHLFDRFVQYMFNRQGMTPTQIEENKERLSWLAQNMALRTQSFFSLDMLQKTWLPSKRTQHLFSVLVGGFYWLITTLVIGIVTNSIRIGSIAGILPGVLGFAIAYKKEIEHTSYRQEISKFKSPFIAYSELFHYGVGGLGIGVIGLLNTTLIWSIILGIIAGMTYWLIRSQKDVKFFLSIGINKRSLPRILSYLLLDIFAFIFMGGVVGFIGYIIGLLEWSSLQTLLLGIVIALLLLLIVFIIYALLVVLFPLFVVLVNSIDFYIRHYILRGLLAFHNILPRIPYHFLDEMVTDGLLRKSGRSYLFIHALLRDHFASSEKNTNGRSVELSRFDVETLRKTGNIHRGKKQFDLALVCFNRAIELNPKGVGLFYDRGCTYQYMEEFKLALADFNHTIELKPKEAAFFRGRGDTYRAIGEYDLSLADFNYAIELNPKGAGLFQGRGYTFQDMEEYELALTDFNRAIQLNPKDAWFFYSRGLTYRAMEEYELSLADINRALELESMWAGFFQDRGITYREMDEYKLTLADFNSAIELEPKWASNFRERGITYREMDEYDLALADFNRAIELEPKWASNFRERGIIKNLLSNPLEAQADFQKALELVKQDYEKYPDNLEESLTLAFYYLIANHEEEALNIYKSAHAASGHFLKRAIKRLDDFLDIFPDHAQAKEMKQLLQQYLDARE